MNIKALLASLVTLISSYLVKPSPAKFLNPVRPTNIQQEIILPTPVPLNLESIFSSFSSSFYISDNETVSLITTGDVIPVRTVNFLMTKRNNFTFPFNETVDFLKNADLTLINLESPLIDNCPLTNTGMIFCGDKRFIKGLKFADIDVASLGNNHVLNYGIQGYCQTVKLLRSNGIYVAGYDNKIICNNTKDRITVREVNGTKLGFLSFNALEKLDHLKLSQTIKEGKAASDFLVVSYHWGGEYLRFPANETIELAHLSIDAGADLIVGNHPHWIQPIEIYKEKLIVYAHGNFIFDQEWSTETKTGMLGKYRLWKNKIIDAKFYPVFIQNFSQPFLLANDEKFQVLDMLEKISREQEQKIKDLDIRDSYRGNEIEMILK